MENSISPIASRRRFLKFLAGSPLLALCDPTGSIEALIGAGSQKTTGWSADEPSTQKLITSADEALNVFDLEAAARQKVPVAHWGYMATGVDDDVTLHANRAAFSKFQI